MRSMSSSACFISPIDSSRIFVRQPLVAPVLAHLGVDEVLVDRGQLAGEDLVERLDELRVALHASPLRLKMEVILDG